MHAAQDAADPALAMRQRFDRRIGLGDAGLEENIQVQPARRDDPEQHERDRTELVERIQPIAEGAVEYPLDTHERALQQALQQLDHRRAARRSGQAASGWRSARTTTTTKSRPPTIATM